MSTFGLPLGALTSFGSSNSPAVGGDRLVFSGAGSVSASADNLPPQVLVAGVDSFDYLVGHQFAVNKSGLAGRPFKDSIVSWTYYVQATGGLSQSATWADLESRMNSLWKWYWGTYTYTNNDGTKTFVGASGQAGDLIVADAGGTVRRAFAEWISFPAKFVAGEISYYQVDLVFRLLEQFQ